jgi:single-strand DNA-binding protein
MNNINLIGRVGQTPELKTAKSGTSFINFSIATNDGFGEKKKTNWHNCTAFGKTAEIIDKYVNKGDEIGVSGSIDYNENDGKRYTTVLVNSITLIGGKKSDNNNNVTNDTSGNYATEIPEQVDRSKAVEVDEKFDDQLPF